MNKFTLKPLSALLSKPYKPNWLIKDHMEKNSIGMIFGEPACAKSFIAMDIAFCIASGLDWNGNDTMQGKVVYIAGEGHSGIGKRFKALELKYGTSTDDVFISTLPASLSDQAGVDAVQEEVDGTCPNPALIVIDTLNCNIGSGDENSARDFAIFIHLMKTTLMASGAAVLIVHHSGHSSGKRARGSSSIKGAMDVEYLITKNKEVVTMDCTKAKEFIEPAPFSFNLVLKPIPDWLDDDGVPVESAVLESTSYVVPAKELIISGNGKIVLQSLIDVLADKGTLATDEQVETYPELDGKKYIQDDDWRGVAYLALDKKSGGNNKPQANQKAFSRGKENLLAADKIVTEDDHYWLAA
jgi:hypothetical protein